MNTTAIPPAETKILPVIGEHIVATPGICGGKPRIAGHRIKVQHIAVWHEHMGWSAQQIVKEFPQLSLGKVYAALSYYHDHREEIEGQIKADEAFVEELKAKSPPSLLQEKMAQRNGQDPLLPPG